MKQDTNYNREQLLDILEGYARMIQRNKDFPTVLLDDLEKSLHHVLKVNGRNIAPKKDYFAILQVPCTDEMRFIVFEPLDRLRRFVGEPNPEHYQLVYTGELEDFKDLNAMLEGLYMKFNIERPADYRARSLSISDVVVLNIGGVFSCHYVDSIGFSELNKDFLDRNSLKEQIIEAIDGRGAAAERQAAAKAVYGYLNRCEDLKALDIESEGYQTAYHALKEYCASQFPELHDSVFGNDDDDFVFKAGDGDFRLYYYNPDSVAGGQIVQCSFDEDGARRILDGEEIFNIVAENTQYLADIDTVHFFWEVFNLIEMKDEGLYLGTDVQEICRSYIADKNRDNVPLAEQIKAAELQKKEPEKNCPEVQKGLEKE